MQATQFDRDRIANWYAKQHLKADPEISQIVYLGKATVLKSFTSNSPRNPQIGTVQNYARRDLNPQPSASEADALSN